MQSHQQNPWLFVYITHLWIVLVVPVVAKVYVRLVLILIVHFERLTTHTQFGKCRTLNLFLCFVYLLMRVQVNVR